MWTYNKPEFEFRSEFSDLHTPWAGHRLFGYDLVANVKPKRLVELGTAKGTSLFSFAQAAKDLELDCELHAIDTWDGDNHTGRYYNVYEDVVDTKNKYYLQQNITLHRALFDDVVNEFDDGSIDILHIDGLHTYEAVKHDFVTWLPKCSRNGIVLFHDTAERMRDFGVHRFWDELLCEYQGVQFMHSHGLGVLFLSTSPLISEFNLTMLSHYYLNAYENVKSELRASKRIEREFNDFKLSPFYRLISVIRSFLRRP